MADLTFNMETYGEVRIYATGPWYLNYGNWKITTNGGQRNLYDQNGALLGTTGQQFNWNAGEGVPSYALPSVISYGDTPENSVVIFQNAVWGTRGSQSTLTPYFSCEYRNLNEFKSFSKSGSGALSLTVTVTAIATYTPAPASINLTLKNNSTIQQIKYKVGTGTETTINAGAQVSISNLANNTVLGINPILTPRPIHFTSNGRIQKITYNAIDYNVFPTDISVDVSGTPTLDITGNPAPEITVDYTNTSEPVITDT